MERNINNSLHQQFISTAEAYPDKIALRCGTKALTYRELDHRSNQLAYALIQTNCTPASRIGLYVERNEMVLIGILGILKAGCTYVPLDPSAPIARLGYQVVDADLAALVTVSTLPLLTGIEQQAVLMLDQLPDDVSAEFIPIDVSAESLAYIIYTSGSTGKPKGVMVSHNNVLRLMSQTEQWYQFSSSDVWTLFHSFAFDVSVFEMWGALLYGGTLVVVPYLVSRSPEQFRQLVQRERVTMLSQTPSAFRQVIEADQRLSAPADYALRFVIFAGEALPLRMLAPWVQRYGDDSPQLINMYGITETTVHAMYRRIVSAEIQANVGSMIGVPIPDLQIHLLNEQHQPVPVGEIGEIYVAGPGVTHGYWQRPALTNARYLTLPHLSSQPIYKSGDLARRIADDELEYIGRNDFQVQLRGFRVELGEIEAALDTHPAVQTSIVQMQGDVGDERLIAWLVPTQTCTTIPWGEVRAHVAKQLPDYMVPVSMIQLDTIPLNINGKRDLAALPSPSRVRPALGYAPVAASDPLEQQLSAIWCDVLNLESVGVTDPFFELGGSSIQAARVVNRVKDLLGEFVYVTALFQAPTVRQFAALLKKDYANSTARLLGSSDDKPTAAQARKPITRATLNKMRRFIPTLSAASPNGTDRQPNGPAIFILSPPRSGTTLLRIMLAGHPELFSAAELLLLNWRSLADRRKAYSGNFALWQEGVIRAVMEIHGCDADAAYKIIADLEAAGMDTQGLYGQIQAWIEPKMLVEKSPAYALDINALRRSEQIFDEPRYVHLVRQPAAMVQSFVKNHLAQVLFLKKHGFDDQTLGELIWTISHQTITTFLKTIPAERQVRIHFETLVAEPEQTMRALCDGIGIAYHPGLITPYQNQEAKMVDGIHQESAPMGDTHFLNHGHIDASVATRWQLEESSIDLSEMTRKLADSLSAELAIL